MARVQGMIFLNPSNMIIEENLGSRILDKLREPCLLVAEDFDGVRFCIDIKRETPQLYQISFGFPYASNILSLGGEEFLDREFPGMKVEPTVGYHVAIQLDLDNMSNPEQILQKVSQFRVHFCGSPLERAFIALETGASATVPAFELKCYQKDSIFVVPGVDRVIVIYSLEFSDATDQSLLDAFMESFPVMQRSVNNSPPCSYSNTVPLELQNTGLFKGTPKNGFISFAIFPTHILGPKKQKVVSLLINFRAYLQYHIKCTKSYLHVRMRNKVDSWLQVLNRAKQTEEKDKKTVTGKTFTRVV